MPGLPPHGRTQGPTGQLKFWRWWWWVGPPTTTSTHCWPCCAIASRPWSWGQVGKQGGCRPVAAVPQEGDLCPPPALAPTRKASLARAWCGHGVGAMLNKYPHAPKWGALCAHVDPGLNLTPRCNVHGAQVVTRQYSGPALRATGTPARTPGAPH